MGSLVRNNRIEGFERKQEVGWETYQRHRRWVIKAQKVGNQTEGMTMLKSHTELTLHDNTVEDFRDFNTS